MKYAHYRTTDMEFIWVKDGERYYPKPDESPDYYVVGGRLYLSGAGLKRQGFKEKDIQELNVDVYTPNPKCHYWAPMRLYSVEKIDQLVPF